jgi:hypothetical protein
MGLAIAGSMVVGLAAYLLYDVWVGAGLALLLAGWAGAAAWVLLGGSAAAWALPPIDPADGAWSAITTVVKGLPPKLSQALPCAAAGGLVSGVSVAILWPRLARAFASALAGLSLLILAAPVAVNAYHPQWLTLFPADARSRLITCAALAAFGGFCQWVLMPKVQKPAGDGGGSGDGAGDEGESEERPARAKKAGTIPQAA